MAQVMVFVNCSKTQLGLIIELFRQPGPQFTTPSNAPWPPPLHWVSGYSPQYPALLAAAE